MKLAIVLNYKLKFLKQLLIKKSNIKKRMIKHYIYFTVNKTPKILLAYHVVLNITEIIKIKIHGFNWNSIVIYIFSTLSELIVNLQ